mmetsp:Transcript_95121/g.307127  ORF Transcript_95121/g.307127 Transcript_95121/m.307127 type:complete len:287 (+) Transcript_95121:345-1205(+)
MPRERLLCPPHLSQELHWPQEPQAQSAGLQCLPAQAAVCVRSPLQPAPPAEPSTSTPRERVLWPAASASQRLQLAQAPSSQSTGRPLRHSGPSRHGRTWLSGPWQELPSPAPWTAILRFRAERPPQRFLQPLHSLHSPMRQSSAGEQETPRLQLACMTEWPTTGRPQSLGSRSTVRDLRVTPPPQVAEHDDQGPHWAQAPSTQPAASQDSVLHGSTSSLSSGWQGSQPGSMGTTLMCRSRLRWPPSQSRLQRLHSDHSPQTQGLQARQRSLPPRQAAYSSRSPLKP